MNTNGPHRIDVIGCGRGVMDLSPDILQIIEKADVIVAAHRFLVKFANHPAQKIPIDRKIIKIINKIRDL
ncbi:hypothetical protein QUF70_18870, partial [Desulfobacterales bacterium HSG17]|nr:hypothetical protein [Desulfobacterales bacterium HSG17]